MLKRLMAVTLAIGLCGMVAWSSGPSDARAGAAPFDADALITEPWGAEGLTSGGGGGGTMPDIDVSEVAGEAGLRGAENYY
jgi:hypothetical protein